MKSSYLCPHCRTLLNPRNEIIMVLSRAGSKGLILFSPEVGDYTTYKAESLELDEGEKVDVLCPSCHANLGSPVAEDFGEIVKKDQDGTLSRVNFSRVVGTQATFVLGGGHVRSFGPDASEFQAMNWFGAGRWEDQI